MKRPPPRISVVIPARNEAAMIASTVGSVLRARDHYHKTRRDGAAISAVGFTDRLVKRQMVQVINVAAIVTTLVARRVLAAHELREKARVR